MDLAINNQQKLMCHEPKETNKRLINECNKLT